MRIISKFKDYYDGAGLGYGVDMNLVYQRNTKDVEISTLPESLILKLNKYLNGLPISRFNPLYSLRPGVIGFCGKLYPVYNYYETSSIPIYFTNFKQFAYIDAKPNPNLPSSFFNKRTKRTKLNSIYSIEEWVFELAEENHSGVIHEDIFHALNTPIFLLWRGSSCLTLNPYLKPFNFQYYFEPLSAFNELSMFIPLLTQKKVNFIVGDDKVIAQSKGHSFKSSFRHVSPNKKERRKLNKNK